MNELNEARLRPLRVALAALGPDTPIDDVDEPMLLSLGHGEVRAIVETMDAYLSLIRSYESVLENMATRHVYFTNVRDETHRHVSWCGACALDVVRDLAARDPISHDAHGDEFVCFFCEVTLPLMDFGPPQTRIDLHEPECLWRRANERPTVKS